MKILPFVRQVAQPDSPPGPSGAPQSHDSPIGSPPVGASIQGILAGNEQALKDIIEEMRREQEDAEGNT